LGIRLSFIAQTNFPTNEKLPFFDLKVAQMFYKHGKFIDAFSLQFDDLELLKWVIMSGFI
jgi:hypothetical protein